MNTMERIRQARAIVRSYEASLKAAKDSVNEWRDRVKHAQVRLNSLLDDESAGVQDLPLGEPDDHEALNRRLEELSAEANGEPAWVKDTFAALVSVGHTDEQARAMLDRAMESGLHFRSNRDAIDWIYKDHDASLIPADPDPDADNDQDEPEDHGEPVEDDDDGPLLPEGEREGWDLVTSRLSVKDQEEEDALAKIEADAAADKPKRRRKAKAQ